MLEPCKSALLLTDIDDTIYWPGARAQELHALHSLCVSAFDIVYLTGRPVDAVVKLISSGSVPSPVLVFCNLGTTLLVGLESRTNPLLSGRNLSRREKKRIRDVARASPSLTEQIIRDNRLSFAISPGKGTIEDTIAAMRSTSVDIWVTHEYVDVLPKGVNKRTAAEFLIARHGSAYQAIVIVGDSENDLHLQAESRHRHIYRIRVVSDGRLPTDNSDHRVKVVNGIPGLRAALAEVAAAGRA
jgi:HAD superfamily hydrolase (TIGR01484 family)